MSVSFKVNGIFLIFLLGFVWIVSSSYAFAAQKCYPIKHANGLYSEKCVTIKQSNKTLKATNTNNTKSEKDDIPVVPSPIYWVTNLGVTSTMPNGITNKINYNSIN